MRMKYILLVAIAVAITIALHHADAGWNFGDIQRRVENAARGSNSLSNEEIIRGLKEALTIGSKKAATTASKIDGYYRNPRLFIPFPPEAKRIKDTAEKIGLDSQVKQFVKTLNRAAEEAAKEAAPIFVDAIKQLTIQDGYKILKGSNDAATRYLQTKTTPRLKQKFRPVVKRATDKVQVTKHWNPLASNYNKMPFVTKVNPDLNEYVTDRAIKGLFVLVADEERRIRKDPAARITELLRRVFGT